MTPEDKQPTPSFKDFSVPSDEEFIYYACHKKGGRGLFDTPVFEEHGYFWDCLYNIACINWAF